MWRYREFLSPSAAAAKSQRRQCSPLAADGAGSSVLCSEKSFFFKLGCISSFLNMQCWTHYFCLWSCWNNRYYLFSPCHKQLDNWSKYMIQLFSDIGQQEYNPWGKGNKMRWKNHGGAIHRKPACIHSYLGNGSAPPRRCAEVLLTAALAFYRLLQQITLNVAV